MIALVFHNNMVRIFFRLDIFLHRIVTLFLLEKRKKKTSDPSFSFFETTPGPKKNSTILLQVCLNIFNNLNLYMDTHASIYYTLKPVHNKSNKHVKSWGKK
jgi:hypothetical protein